MRQDEKKCGIIVRQQSRRRDNRYRNGVAGWTAGMWVKDVVVTYTIYFIITLIVTGSRNRFLGVQLNYAKIAASPAGILQSDAPWFTVGFRSYRLDVADGIDKGVSNTFVFG